MLLHFHFLAVLVAALSAFVLGGIWYSPLAFGNLWHQEAGNCRSSENKSHGIKIFLLAFILSFIAASVFEFYLGANSGFFYTVGLSLLIGIAWISSSFGINYLFAGKSVKLFLIDAGYHVVQFLLYGIILGLWHKAIG